MSLILGCIADDFTGATDMANMLVKSGLKTVQLIGVPSKEDDVPLADAIVIALKSRTIPAKKAVKQSLKALDWLQCAGAKQFFFKYCSTFDSTDKGNIGPVTEALMDSLGTDFTIACPAFPETGRTIFKGHLFVGDTLLSNSPMRYHPLTPMNDSNLVSLLSRQTNLEVGLVQHQQVRAGPEAIRKAFTQLKTDGVSIAITDAVNDEELITIGEAVSEFKLITGGSGISMGLPNNYRRSGLLSNNQKLDQLFPVEGHELILSGSCSEMTLAQVKAFANKHAAYQLNPLKLAADSSSLDATISWIKDNIKEGPVLVYASAPPETVRKVQKKLGRLSAGSLVEGAMAKISKEMVSDGVRRLVIAGGETAGAVVSSLAIKGLIIGEQIDPGVPGTISIGAPRLALALKSGNFGSINFFEKALRNMP